MVKLNRSLRCVAVAVIAGVAGLSVAPAAFAYDDHRDWHRDHDRHWHRGPAVGFGVEVGPSVVYAPPPVYYAPPPPPPVVGFGLDFRIR